MINPTKQDIKRKVVYKRNSPREEHGFIKSFNNSFVFVVYDKERRDLNAQATRREDLEWDNG